MQTRQNRRKKYLINPSLQGKMIGVTILLILLVAGAGSIPLLLGGVVSDIHSNVNVLAVLMLIVVVFALIVVVFYGLRMSHRVAGPVFAFSRHLNLIRRGVYAKDLHIRSTDELANLCSSFNAMQSALRLRSKQTIDVCSKATTNLEQLKKVLATKGEDPEKTAQMIEILIKDLEELSSETQKLVAEE